MAAVIGRSDSPPVSRIRAFKSIVKRAATSAQAAVGHCLTAAPAPGWIATSGRPSAAPLAFSQSAAHVRAASLMVKRSGSAPPAAAGARAATSASFCSTSCRSDRYGSASVRNGRVPADHSRCGVGCRPRRPTRRPTNGRSGAPARHRIGRPDARDGAQQPIRCGCAGLRLSLEAGEAADQQLVQVGIAGHDGLAPRSHQQRDPGLRQRLAQQAKRRGGEQHVAQVIGPNQQHRPRFSGRGSRQSVPWPDRSQTGQAHAH